MNAALKGYAGERVFLTGDTGFKGSWLAYWLTRLGAEVSGYALPPEHERGLYTRLGMGELVDHTDGDVRDLDALVAAMRRARPRVVFHLAAQALVKPSYDDPVGTYATNVMGSVHLLEAVRRVDSVESVVFVTSDKSYKNKEWAWGYRESDELGGHDPYSASKAAAEVVFASYRDAFFGADAERPVGLASVRAGNVIGGGDEAHARIVPDCIRALRAGEALVLRRPEARR
ncbi:MAG: CDP-glucose 4,6-dehydratase, partial [Deltaproteobacteria bacterium]